MLGAPAAVLVQGTVVHDGRGVLQVPQGLLGCGGGDAWRTRRTKGPSEQTWAAPPASEDQRRADVPTAVWVACPLPRLLLTVKHSQDRCEERTWEAWPPSGTYSSHVLPGCPSVPPCVLRGDTAVTDNQTGPLGPEGTCTWTQEDTRQTCDTQAPPTNQPSPLDTPTFCLH